MVDLAKWLEGTRLSIAFQGYSPVVWPIAQIVHFIGLSLLIAGAGFVDLRLMGVVRRVNVVTAMEFIPLAIVGFTLNLLSGLYFIIAQPVQYARSGSFRVKVIFLIVAGLNAIIFQIFFAQKCRGMDPDEDLPTGMKLIGGLSLFSWFAVLYFGRMIPFLWQPQ